MTVNPLKTLEPISIIHVFFTQRAQIYIVMTITYFRGLAFFLCELGVIYVFNYQCFKNTDYLQDFKKTLFSPLLLLAFIHKSKRIDLPLLFR